MRVVRLLRARTVLTMLLSVLRMLVVGSRLIVTRGRYFTMLLLFVLRMLVVGRGIGVTRGLLSTRLLLFVVLVHSTILLFSGHAVRWTCVARATEVGSDRDYRERPPAKAVDPRLCFFLVGFAVHDCLLAASLIALS